MLLRDAQEEVRVLGTALRDSAATERDPLCSQVATASALLRSLKAEDRADWGETVEDRAKAVGILMLVALGLANEFAVDSAEALKASLLEASP